MNPGIYRLNCPNVMNTGHGIPARPPAAHAEDADAKTVRRLYRENKFGGLGTQPPYPRLDEKRKVLILLKHSAFLRPRWVSSPTYSRMLRQSTAHRPSGEVQLSACYPHREVT